MTNKSQNYKIIDRSSNSDLIKHLYILSPSHNKWSRMLDFVRLQIASPNTTAVNEEFWRRDD